MIEPLIPDLALLGAVLAVAVGFAAFMSWRGRGSQGSPMPFSTYVLEAVTAEAAIVMILSYSLPAPGISPSMQRAFVSITAMMTLIFVMRDIIRDIRRQRKHESGPDDRSKAI
jgi:hypothetical protein